MPSVNVDALAGIVIRVPNYSVLTPAERAEIIRIAQGYACKDSAAAADVSPETIRARRKRIYRKLDVPGAGELISRLLALSLESLVRRESVTPRDAEVTATETAPDPGGAERP
jgi:DNA-binding CsgD family transcriptional regulator